MRSTSFVPFRAPVFLLAVIIAFSSCWLAPSASGSGTAGVLLRGIVVDSSGQPLSRATVTIRCPGQHARATATSPTGHFSVRLADSSCSLIDLRVTSVGFHPVDSSLHLDRDTIDLTIICRPDIIDAGHVLVTGERLMPAGVIRLNRQAVNSAALKSLIPSDPLAAIRYPQLAHYGLNCASQLRIDGSVPHYYLNSISIGADPTHFGALSFIPTPAVDEITFSPQGTSARFGVPSVIELRSAERFTPTDNHGELSVSVVDMSGSLFKGNSKRYAGGTVRRSLINELSSTLDFGSSRQEIPSPKLTDVVLGVGYKPAERLSVLSDLYHIEDNLRYSLGEKAGAEGVTTTEQFGTENHASVRVAYQGSRLRVENGLGIRTGHRDFNLYPIEAGSSPFRVDFRETYNYYQLSSALNYITGPIELQVGNQYESVAGLDLHLRQVHWNLLSPFAHSDNLNLFQTSIDRFYASYDGSLSGFTNGLFTTGIYRNGIIQVESGLRYDYFSYLGDKGKLSIRESAKFSIGDRSSVTLFYGTFHESPVTTAMESYQVPVRIYAGQLKPVRSHLATGALSIGNLTIETFYKEMFDQPALTPDYQHIWDTIGGLRFFPNPRFLIPHSTARSTFRGISAELTVPRLLDSCVGVYLSYAYSRARTTISGVTMPHDLDAPHRFNIQVEAIPGKHWRLSADFAIHTGYPYTPPQSVSSYSIEFPPTTYYYMKDLRVQNSQRFSPNASLNLHCSFTAGRARFFVSVINITNHANAIIRSLGDFIYDAGIIPNIGFQYRF